MERKNRKKNISSKSDFDFLPYFFLEKDGMLQGAASIGCRISIRILIRLEKGKRMRSKPKNLFGLGYFYRVNHPAQHFRKNEYGIIIG